MKTTREFLAAVRVARGLTSDYQLARALGITTAAVSQLQAQKAFLGETTALKVAVILGIDPAHVLATVAAERARDGEVKKAWQRAAAATAALVLVQLALLCDWGIAPAVQAVKAAVITHGNIHYTHVAALVLVLVAGLALKARRSRP